MLKRSGIFLIFCVIVGTGTLAAFTDSELEQYRTFTAVHMQEVALWAGNAPATAKNIFYMGAEETEWEQLESLFELYFSGLSSENQDERLAQLQKILVLYRVTIKTSNPIGLYHIGRDEVYVDPSLFKAGANMNYAASIVFHEKVHQNQNRTFDRSILKVDQKQKYSEKLEEIAAHYQQIRYVLGKGDTEALRLTLKNSNRWNMFPGILRTYPGDDGVVRTINDFLTQGNS